MGVGSKWWRRSLALWAMATISPAAVGCSPDIFDLSIDLEKEVYTLDFGDARGDVPAIACDEGAANVCSGASLFSFDASTFGVPATVDLAPGCDPATQRCYAQGTVRAPYTVSVLSDSGFANAVGRDATRLVRVADLGYTVPVNTLNFYIPELDIYVGPEGIGRETDPDVVAVGSTTEIVGGQTIGETRHLTVADGSPARDRMEGDIQGRRPFTFVLVLSPRLESGEPIPAGTLEIDVTPRLFIGLPR